MIVWKIFKNLSVVSYSWLFWISLNASNYPLRHYDISLNNFWSSSMQLNIWVGEAKSLFSRFFSGKTDLLALQRRFHKTRHCTGDCCIRNINAQFVQLGRDTQKQKFVQITVFPMIFVTGIWIRNKHFSSVFKPKI